MKNFGKTMAMRETILARIASGEPLRAIGRDLGLTHYTIARIRDGNWNPKRERKA